MRCHFHTIHSYILCCFENKKVADEADKTEEESAVHEEEGNEFDN